MDEPLTDSTYLILLALLKAKTWLCDHEANQ